MKVHKQENKTFVYIPLEMIKELGLKEGDDVEFLRYSDKAYLVAKKAELASMIMGSARAAPQKAESYMAPPERVKPMAVKTPSVSYEEISVLKKIDTLRYPQRTAANLKKLLDKNEIIVLKGLIARKLVSVIQKDKSVPALYSISANVYNDFLMRKKPGTTAATQKVAQAPAPAPSRFSAPSNPAANSDEVATLDQQGYLVVNTESEAARVSLLLEDSIRHGLVLGTRSFNKNREFFIVTRRFLDKHMSVVFKLLREGDQRAPAIAEAMKVDEDGARAVLYILAESGDVREKRKDLFALA